ncbi:MAG: glycosyl transferase [Patescibacteria group bacterium]|nr:MAG: glycosyl transferase [Patescibacteria group bacterium]
MNQEQKHTPSVALVYDRVNTSYGGAEVVLTAIHELFPQAPIFTSVYHSQKAQWAKNITIIPSFLQKIPFFNDKHQVLLPLMPLAFESFDLSAYDIVISVTSAEAKGVLTKPNQKHICYMLTPTRYLYSHHETYLSSKWYLQLPIMKQLVEKILNHIKKWDLSASTRPDVIVPISKLVAQRVKTFYNRKTAPVIYPPVSVLLSEKEINDLPVLHGVKKFYLSISRLVEYKRIDLSISACLKLKKPLVIVGEGESKQKLHSLAGGEKCIKEDSESIEQFMQRATKENKTILFTGKLSQKETYTLFKNCEAVLMPGQEDFGITGLEAGIFGKPVILFYTSGVAELLQDSVHAIHIKKETVSEMIYALGKLDSLSFDAQQLRAHAMQYSVEKFKREFKARVEKELKG